MTILSYAKEHIIVMQMKAGYELLTKNNPVAIK